MTDNAEQFASRRQFPRRNTRLIGYCTSERLGSLVPALLWNLGPGGAGLQLRTGQVGVGDRLELILSLPDEPLRIVVEAEVVWVKAAEELGLATGCRFGVRFESASAADLRQIRDYVFLTASEAERQPG